MGPEAVSGRRIGTFRSRCLDGLQVGAMPQDRVACRIGLRSRERAHRIDQAAAWGEQVGGGGRDRDLEPRQTGELLSTGTPQQLRPSARGAYPRTRSVHEHPIEGITEGGPDGVLGKDQGVEPEPLEPRGDQGSSVGMEVTGDDPSLSPDTA